MKASIPFSILFLLLTSSALFAGDEWRISVLASDIAEAHDVSTDTHAGVGVALAYMPDPRWDVELAVASQSYRSAHTHFEPVEGFPLGVPVTTFPRYRVHPVDLMLTRHFMTASRVSPYVRAGARYVDAPDDPRDDRAVVVPPFSGFVPVRAGFGFSDRTSAQAGAGVRVRLTSRTALRAEVMRLLRSESAPFDALTRGAVGLSWQF